ncbi:MAG: hypothetical protein KJ915_00830 [Candidatus Omnitrophica bacterium]|nr:hypothetical protein [Candidatus Omnitrophota bacterium]
MNIRGNMMKLKGLMFRGAALFCLMVLSVSVLFAQEQTAKAEPKDIFNLIIPSSWGNVKDIYKGNSKEVIVHIQDAHANYEAQTNIANIIDLLVENYGLKIVGIEGSVGKLQTDLFSTFPEDAIRTQAADLFVREGKLSGPEALAISKGFEYPLALYGIEDKQLYDNNFKAFQDSLPFKSEAKSYFNHLSSCLATLKSYLYNPKLANIDKQQLSFDLRIMSLNDYCLFLNDELAGSVQDLAKYPNFSSLLKAIKIEGTLDFAKAEEERTKLLTELTNLLSEEDIRSLLDNGLAYKNEQLSAARYLSFVKEMAIKSEIDFTQYANLDKYIVYATSYDQIKSFELFNEIEEVDAAIRVKNYTNPEQKQLDLLVRGLKVMERLVDIKMVNKDLEFYSKYQNELKVDKYLTFISSQADKLGIKIASPVDIAYLDVYIPAWVDFYKVAGFRDDAMINNELTIINEAKEKIGVMVTGGFHTAELTRKMKEKDISYIVITPRITKNIAGPYFDRLTGKKSALDILMDEFNAVVPAVSIFK